MTNTTSRRLDALFLFLFTACSDPSRGETSLSTDPTSATPATTPTSATAPTSTGSEGAASTADVPTSGSVESTTGSASSTDGGVPANGACQEACESDRDCLVDGVDQGLVCYDSRCAPAIEPNVCSSDLYCAVAFPGLHSCESSGDCPDGYVCIDLEGRQQDMCGRLADDRSQCPNTKYFDVGEQPTTEGNLESICIGALFCDLENSLPYVHYCIEIPSPCVSDSGCSKYPTAPICAGDGTCICDDDAQCIAPGLPTCVAGSCSCTSDADCAVLGYADVCVDGKCGCSSAAVCPKETHYDGTQPVCEPL